MKLNVYLNFQGNTEEVFNFYKSVFGGEFDFIQRFRDVPGMQGLKEDEKDKLMHVSLKAGENNLMGTDALESMGQKVVVGNNISLSLHPESRAEADRLFAGLSEGGKVDEPMADAPWGDYWGMFSDKFGINWMINYSEK